MQDDSNVFHNLTHYFPHMNGQPTTCKAHVNLVYCPSQPICHQHCSETWIVSWMFQFGSNAGVHSDQFFASHITTATSPENEFLHIHRECEEPSLELGALHEIENKHKIVTVDVKSRFCSLYNCRHVKKKLEKEKIWKGSCEKNVRNLNPICQRL